MDEIKGDDDEGLKYVFLGDSGVIQIGKPTRWDEKPPEKPSRRAQEQVEHLLKISDTFRVRTEIRNSLRKWHEKIPCVADLLDHPYLPKMSAQEVYNEHQKMVERKVQRAAYSARDSYPAEALLILKEDGNLDKDDNALKSEEFAKQVSFKFEWYIKHVGYDEAADYVKWTLAGMEDESAKGEVIEAVRLTVGQVLSDLIRQGYADDAVKAFFRLGTVCRLEREDFFDVKDIEMRNPRMQKAFLKALAEVAGDDPQMDLYPAVRDSMCEAGFFTGKEADSSSEVEIAVRNMLNKALEEHAIIYVKTLNALKEAGLGTAASVEAENCRKVLISRLVKKMRQSPQLYAIIRDRWESWRIMENAHVANNREISMVFSDHLQRCFDRHPFFYSKMKYWWKSFGLTESRSDESGHTMTANWIAGLEFGEGEFGEKLVKDFEDEKAKVQRMVEGEDADENNSVRKFRLFYEAKRKVFVDKYPQYADDVTGGKVDIESGTEHPAKK